jgi:uncharacterized DUF497 family protein
MIVWDEAKRKTNLEKHGLDFVDAVERGAEVQVISFRVASRVEREVYEQAARVRLIGIGSRR